MKISLKYRKARYTYGSVSGFYAFRKEKSIWFESTLERDMLVLLEYYDSVLDVESQPVTLEYINQNGKNVPYTPDFLVHFKYSPTQGMFTSYPKPLLIEVKPHKKLQRHFKEYRERFKIAMKYARENGYVFKIFDERKIRGQEFSNINFLARYKNLQYDQDEEDRMMNHLKAVGHTTVDHFLEYLCVTDEQKGIAQGQLWHLLASKKVACDIGLPLGQHTIIWPNIDQSYEEGVLYGN